MYSKVCLISPSIDNNTNSYSFFLNRHWVLGSQVVALFYYFSRHFRIIPMTQALVTCQFFRHFPSFFLWNGCVPALPSAYDACRHKQLSKMVGCHLPWEWMTKHLHLNLSTSIAATATCGPLWNDADRSLVQWFVGPPRTCSKVKLFILMPLFFLNKILLPCDFICENGSSAVVFKNKFKDNLFQSMITMERKMKWVWPFQRLFFQRRSLKT